MAAFKAVWEAAVGKIEKEARNTADRYCGNKGWNDYWIPRKLSHICCKSLAVITEDPSHNTQLASCTVRLY